MTLPDTPSMTSTTLLLVDVISLGETDRLSIGWPSADSSTRPIDPLSVERLKSQFDTLDRAEHRRHDEAISTARGALGRTLWDLLNGPEGHLNRALEAGAAQDRSLDLVIRLRGSRGGGLAHHPATTWRWELLSPQVGEHPCADGRIRVAVQMGDVSPTADPQPLEYGGLRIMFMAYSPQGVEPVLAYEGEEDRLLQSLEGPIRNNRVQVHVVEDGTLEELERRLGDARVDVLHLTGHGTLTPEGPRLVMEDDLGWPDLVTPGDLLRVLKRADGEPKLVVISSCHSAEGRDGVPSFAAALVAGGIPAVLGWGRPVRDDVATKAAADLYGRLCRGRTPVEAAAYAREQLLEWDEQEASHGRPRSHAWGTMHLLMRDAGGFVVQTDGGKPLPKTTMGGEALYRYLGVTGGMKVLERGFLGRRRQLQRVLRVLRAGKDDGGMPVAGVTVLGMKGVGKSCMVGRVLARHLQDRCSTGVVVLHGVLDEVTILDRFLDLAMKREDGKAEALLKGQGDEPMARRLRRLLTAHWAEESIIIVLDDFEQNLELRDDGDALMSSQAAALLEVLLPVCQAHRPSILMTTTASFRVPTGYERALVELQLESFKAPTIRKLWTRLPGDDRGKISPNAWSHLADRLGRNARVLDWALTLLRGKTPEEVKAITRRAGEALPVWTEGAGPNDEHVAGLVRLFLRTLAVEETREKLSRDALTFIERARVYEWPVPQDAFEGLIAGLDINLGRDLTVLQNLGMLEVGEMDGMRAHRVSPLVEPKFEADESERWHAVAAEFWEGASKREGSRDWFARIMRAWEHALDGRLEEVASHCGRRIHVVMIDHGDYRHDRELARRHRRVFPESSRGYLWEGAAEAQLGELRRGWDLYEKGEALARGEGVTGDALQEIACEGAEILRNLGRLEEAEERLLAVAAESRDDDRQTFHAGVLVSLAQVQQDYGRIAPARINLETAVSIFERLHAGEGGPALSAALHELAGVLQLQDDLLGARGLLRRSLSIDQKLYGREDHPSIAATHHELGVVLKKQGDLKGARALFERVLDADQGIWGTDGHFLAINSRYEFARVLGLQGDFVRAQAQLQKCLVLYREVHQTDANSYVAATLHEMAHVLNAQGDIAGAREYFELSRAAWINAWGTEERLEVAASFYGLACVLRLERDYVGARECLERSLTIIIGIRGSEDHRDVADAYTTLVEVLRDQGELCEAIVASRRAIDISVRVFGSQFHHRVVRLKIGLGMLLLADQGAVQTADDLESQRARQRLHSA